MSNAERELRTRLSEVLELIEIQRLVEGLVERQHGPKGARGARSRRRPTSISWSTIATGWS